MNDREEFDKWLDATYTKGIDNWAQRALLDAWQARQPEIDALKELVTDATNEMTETTRALIKLGAERDALKAENERLREEIKRAFYAVANNSSVPIRVAKRLEDAMKETK